MPDPELALRHSGTALLIRRELVREPPDEDCIRQFLSVERPLWLWPLLLDGAAQAAGLCAADQQGLGRVVATYDQLEIEKDAFSGTVIFSVQGIRRVMSMLQFSVVARQRESQAECLRSQVTLAPVAEAKSAAV